MSQAEKGINKLDRENAFLKGVNQNLSDTIEINDSILQSTIKRNGELNTSNASLSVINTELSNYNKSLIQYAKNWTIIALLIFIIGFAILSFLTARISKQMKKNKALKREAFGLQSQLEANRLAKEIELKYNYEKHSRELTIKHEIVGVISDLYAGYTNRFLPIYNNGTDIGSKLSDFGKRFNRLESFSRFYYKLLRTNEFNGINDELELCKKYAEVAKINKGEIIFHDSRTVKREDIVLPHHFLNNFTKNSIEKGKIDNESLFISIEDRLDNDNYFLILSDNGKGLPANFDLSKLPDESTGLRNVFTQLKYFNSKKEIPYTIEFDGNSIKNKEMINGKTGVIILLQFKPKK